MKRVILTMALLGLGGSFSCSPKIDPNIIPPSPSKTETVIPSVVSIGKKIDRSIDKNKEAASKIKEQKDAVAQQNAEIKDAIIQAEKIKKDIQNNNPIQEEVTISLLEKLKTIQTRNLFLETKIGELIKINDDSGFQLNELKFQSEETLRKLIDKEKETDDLRTQNEFLANSIKIKSIEISKLEKSLESEKITSANAKVYKHWVMGLIGSFVLWTVLKNVLMLYFPATKFRF